VTCARKRRRSGSQSLTAARRTAHLCVERGEPSAVVVDLDGERPRAPWRQPQRRTEAQLADVCGAGSQRAADRLDLRHRAAAEEAERQVERVGRQQAQRWASALAGPQAEAGGCRARPGRQLLAKRRVAGRLPRTAGLWHPETSRQAMLAACQPSGGHLRQQCPAQQVHRKPSSRDPRTSNLPPGRFSDRVSRSSPGPRDADPHEPPRASPRCRRPVRPLR